MVIELHVLKSGEEAEWQWSEPSGMHEHRFKRPTLSNLCSLLVIYVCMRERICLCEIKGEKFVCVCVCVCVRERERKREGEVEICSRDQELEKQKVKKRSEDRYRSRCTCVEEKKQEKKIKKKHMDEKKKLKKERKNNIRNKISKLSNITMIFSQYFHNKF